MSKKQEALIRLYRSVWPKWAEVLDAACEKKEADGGRRHISYPFLLNVDATDYEMAKEKLLVVGKQTNGWWCIWGQCLPKGDIIQSVIEEFGGFNLGEKYRSNFIKASENLACEVSGGPKKWMWTNVIKVDEAGGTPNDDITRELAGELCVLRDEIEILEPDVVVFFTGHSYDRYIEANLSAELVEVEGCDKWKLGRFISPYLPAASYRTYHPDYFQRKERWIPRVLAGIVTKQLKEQPKR